MNMKLVDLASAIGIVHDGDQCVNGINIDTRLLQIGDVFVAVKGSKVDGHDYLRAAQCRGAVAAIVNMRNTSIDLLQFEVTNTVCALGNIAAKYREQLLPLVIGVTGSYGKTSTKDMIAAVMGASAPSHATSGNFNTEFGLPLTILAAPRDTQNLILEMGMRGPGQIAELCQIARPTIGVLTNLGSSHLELLGSMDAITLAKCELFASLPATGTAVISQTLAHNEIVMSAIQHCKRLIVGDGPSCDVRYDNVEASVKCVAFSVTVHGVTHALRLPTPARFAVENACLSIAAGVAAGVDVSTAVSALSKWLPSEGRMKPRVAVNGATVLSDAYNAAPEAVVAAIGVLADSTRPGSGETWAVLGEMRELGAETERWHQIVGEAVAEARIDHLVIVGDAARMIRVGALYGGMCADKIHMYSDPESAAQVLGLVIMPSDTVLVKGSRVAGLNKVVDALCGAG